MRKLAFCICEKGADLPRGNCAANQCLYFCYLDSTIPLFSYLLPSSVAVQPGLCRTWSETLKTGFFAMPLICKVNVLKFQYQKRANTIF